VAAIFQGKTVISIAATMRVGLIQVLGPMANLIAILGKAAQIAAAQLDERALEKMRAVAFAGAGVCVGLTLTILQISPRDGLLLSLCLASLGISLFAAAAFMVQNHISHGAESLTSLRSPLGFWLMFLVSLAGGTSLVISLTCALNHYYASLGWAFLLASALVSWLVVWHNIATKPGS
jgi:hypothetical protein